MVKEEYDNQLLVDYAPLLHRTLHRAGVSPRHPSYDDYYQELSLKLLDLKQKFEGDPLGLDRYSFVAYARRGLSWYLLDLFGRDRSPEEVTDTIEDLLEPQASPLAAMDSHLTLMAFHAKARQVLDDDDYQLFLYLKEGASSMSILAQELQISRQALYKRRDRLKKKLQDFKYLID